MGAAEELRIAGRGSDGTLGRWTPIWVVCAGGQVYVRTWYRRDSGWFGRVLDSRRARIRVDGMEADVAVEDVGEGPAGVRAGIPALSGHFGLTGAARPVFEAVLPALVRWFGTLAPVSRLRVLDRVLGLDELPRHPPKR
jgi:Uncharacterized protein conserved in bacteria (DUF2255)